MSIRQRTWESRGKVKTAWVYDYFDTRGKRRLKTFRTKKEAVDWSSQAHVDVKRGTHIADSASVTVEEAGKLWVETGKGSGLVKSSMEQCRQHLDLHIKPFIGGTKLSKLTVPSVRAFETQLREAGRSAVLTRKVIASLGGILADAMERGLAMHNPVREMRANRGKRRTKATRERKVPLEIGKDIPEASELKAILNAATGYRRAFFAVAALGGLRASELRGLRWEDVDLAKGNVTVRQRADAWGNIDVPKSEAGHRTIPLPPLAVAALKEWKLQCPRRKTGKEDADCNPITVLHYVFPNGKGHIENHTNIVQRHWLPLQIEAGVSVPVQDDDGNPAPAIDDDGKPVVGADGKPVMQVKAKYSGLHALRHFFCSWCAAPTKDGGLGLTLKTTQVRMGHSTLAMTSDRYGHLWPSQDDSAVLAAGERALMGA